MKKLLLLALFLLFSLFLTDLFAVTPAGVYNNTVIDVNGRPVAGATITVCTYQSNPTSPPAACSPSVQVYRDSALSVAKTNPFNADSHGNFEFWVAPGLYTVQLTGANVTRYNLTADPVCSVTICGNVGAGAVLLAPVGDQNIAGGFKLSVDSIISAKTGFRINNMAPLGHVPLGNGTDYVDGALAFTAIGGTITDAQLANPYSGVGACTAGQFATALNRNAPPTCGGVDSVLLAPTADQSITGGFKLNVANVVNATTGFQINGLAPLNHVPLGNGTNYVDGTLPPASVSLTMPVEFSVAGTGPINVTKATESPNSVWAGPLSAAGSFQVIQSNAAITSSATTVNISFSTSVTAGNFVAVICGAYAGCNAPTDNRGDTFALASSGFSSATIYYTCSAVGGSTTVTQTYGSIANSIDLVHIVEVAGVKSSGCLDVKTDNGGSYAAGVATVSSPSITGADMVLAAFCDCRGGTAAWTPGTGYQQIQWNKSAGAGNSLISEVLNSAPTSGVQTATANGIVADIIYAAVAAFKLSVTPPNQPYFRKLSALDLPGITLDTILSPATGTFPTFTVTQPAGTGANNSGSVTFTTDPSATGNNVLLIKNPSTNANAASYIKFGTDTAVVSSASWAYIGADHTGNTIFHGTGAAGQAMYFQSSGHYFTNTNGLTFFGGFRYDGIFGVGNSSDASTDPFQVSTAGQIRRINGATTANAGVHVVSYSQSLAAQTALIADTTVLTQGAGPTGWYIAHGGISCDSANATATATLNLKWTDTSTTAQTRSVTANCATLGPNSDVSLVNVTPVKGSTTVTWGVTITGTPTYSVYFTFGWE
jgi:hypothetical protein